MTKKDMHLYKLINVDKTKVREKITFKGSLKYEKIYVMRGIFFNTLRGNSLFYGNKQFTKGEHFNRGS